VEINVSERLAYLCDVRLGAGDEGFDEELDDKSHSELVAILGEAVDALWTRKPNIKARSDD
jgi:hypothetical protein